VITALEAIKIPKVLIADDDPAVVQFLAVRCEQMGFDVHTATNGLQALMMARRTVPDVLIVDVHMPQLDGLSVCLRLLNQQKHVEVIVITGSSAREIAERCESFGAIHERKGPALWTAVHSALVALFPNMALNGPKGLAANAPAIISSRPRVLVVDDDADVANFLGSRILKCGVDMLHASDGAQGYRIACRELPSVIISDCFMPEGDIYFLLWKLRSTPATEKLPVFAMSGRRLDAADEANLRREVCGHPGAVRFFRKPLDTDALFQAIQEHCAFDHTADRG
jgi:CheY-like chemotaxis protein